MLFFQYAYLNDPTSEISTLLKEKLYKQIKKQEAEE